MSEWYTGIASVFFNDMTRDVLNGYRFGLEEGLSDSEASRNAIGRYAGDKPQVVLALAVAQWHFGRLDPHVKRRALEAITEGRVADLWESSLQAQEAQANLLVQLERPQRRRRVVRPKWGFITDLEVGDVLAAPPNESGTIILRVVGIVADEDSRPRTRTPTFEVYWWSSPELPSLADIAMLEPERRWCLSESWRVHLSNSRRDPDWRDAGFTLLGRLPIANPPPSGVVTQYSWESAARQIQRDLRRP